jgi:putative ABC transport system ATP-binding protein
MSILSIRNLTYAYQDGATQRYILNDISYDFEPGRFYAILGNSGSGKTTLLSLMGALDAPKSGEVIYQGSDVKALGYEGFRRNHVSIVFQSYNLIPWLTAVENVLVAMNTTNNKLPADHRTVASNLLDYFGIDRAKANRRVPQLSGGEQQRVAIARALATNVDLILADEPTGNLDETSSEEIVQIFRTLAHEHGKCVVVVTHAAEIAREADAVLHLSKGVLNVAPGDLLPSMATVASRIDAATAAGFVPSAADPADAARAIGAAGVADSAGVAGTTDVAGAAGTVGTVPPPFAGADVAPPASATIGPDIAPPLVPPAPAAPPAAQASTPPPVRPQY